MRPVLAQEAGIGDKGALDGGPLVGIPALKYGRTSIAVYRNTRKKSSRISFRRESFHGTFTSVGPIPDFGGAAVTPLQAVELALVDDAAAVQQ